MGVVGMLWIMRYPLLRACFLELLFLSWIGACDMAACWATQIVSIVLVLVVVISL